ncbi:M20 peptidase family dipeptidase [Siculibacillus lacustris]|uniref:M20 peptidase family dipeptidase n=1 Tax=Siculibacillus lacustris TaxID=1549641 RepID=A0A4Q9VXY2_9HYPH|nr:M20 family metallopeptidase [Siculibacillus lacustris]TBW41357.1 M20 peptidase family dipeptidase [Siculibacillus lacustris]
MPPVATREGAIARAADHFASGAFRADLGRRVAMKTESQAPDRAVELRAYLTEEMMPSLDALGFSATVMPNAVIGHGPFLLAERHEGDHLPTVLIYGHGDVVLGHEGRWRDGRSPWEVTVDGDRWYGRGTADNKGQHSINIAALAQVVAERGTLGFNAKILIEMGEETGSPGLRALAETHRAALAADVLIASDGPRVGAERPTVFLGSRGTLDFELTVNLREGAHHSGNWGGLLANPGIVLANAIAVLVDGRGRIRLHALRPPAIPPAVRAALADLSVGGGVNDPVIDRDWGEPGLTPEERVFGWNSLEVLAFECGTPSAPVNAVPASAKAALQLRFVVGTDPSRVIDAIRDHLEAVGLRDVTVTPGRMEVFAATRLDPTDPWVDWALASLARTTGKKPALLPNLGGSIPNDVFSELLGLPTLWVPHSYPACSQHAPDEHLLGSVAEEALRIMTGLFWDLGETGAAIKEARRA